MRHLLVLHPDPSAHRKAREAFDETDVRVHSARCMADIEPLLANGVDILLLGTSLPDGNGYDAARMLRDRFPAALVLFATNSFEVFDEERAYENGCDAVLRSPMSAEDMRSLIASLIAPLQRQSPATVEVVDQWEGQTPQPPMPEEQLASFLPRTGLEEDPMEAWRKTGEAMDPVLRVAVLRALPQVVEGAVRTALRSSPDFRQMVAEAVREALEDEKTSQSSTESP